MIRKQNQFVTAHPNRFVWDAHPTKTASCRCQFVETPPLHTWILPSQMFYDSTLYPQTVHSCKGLMPTNRITSSPSCFFRVSFCVTKSPSLSILIFRTSFHVTSQRCQTGMLGSSTSTASPSTCVRIALPESSVVASIQCLTHLLHRMEGINFPNLGRKP